MYKSNNKKIYFDIFGDTLVNIEENIYNGNYSPDKKYFSASGGNKVILINCQTNSIQFIKQGFKNPLLPHAIPNNNGFVSFFDTLDIKQLITKCYILDDNGNILFNTIINALPWNYHLDENNTYGCFQMCNNNEHVDGGIFFIVDISSQKIIHKWYPITGWADSYVISPIKQEITFFYNDGNTFNYSFEGELLDKEKWEELKFQKLNGYDLFNLADEKLSIIKTKPHVTLTNFDEVIRLFSSAYEKDISPNYKAMSMKKIGEIYLKLDDTKKAIKYFKRALKHNDKIGVKRLISTLEKETKR